MATSCTSGSTFELTPLSEGTVRGLRRISLASGRPYHWVETEFRDLLSLRSLAMRRLEKPWKQTLVEALALQELQDVYAERNGQKVAMVSYRMPPQEVQR